jgi:GrpB-like predicted nucleotidyltransferase (UPF0157 family)
LLSSNFKIPFPESPSDHIVEFNGESWRLNLKFRDALKVNRSLRAEYLKMKELAVAQAPEGRARYNELKHSFFERVENQLAEIQDE